MVFIYSVFFLSRPLSPDDTVLLIKAIVLSPHISKWLTYFIQKLIKIFRWFVRIFICRIWYFHKRNNSFRNIKRKKMFHQKSRRKVQHTASTIQHELSHFRATFSTLCLIFSCMSGDYDPTCMRDIKIFTFYSPVLSFAIQLLYDMQSWRPSFDRFVTDAENFNDDCRKKYMSLLPCFHILC